MRAIIPTVRTPTELSQGGTKNPEKPTRPIRGLNAQAHPNGPTAARGTSESRHLLIPTGSRAPSLTTQAMEEALAFYSHPSPYTGV